MQKGKLIVIEGPDGSGKTEQWKLLAQRLKKEGHQIELVDFPQYSKVSAGLISNYLRGIYGKPDEVSPYAASLFYALDRYDLSFKMRQWLAEGKIILANRYVASNGGHQGGKIHSERERKNFLKWLYRTEYEILGISKPDINVFLDLPMEVSLRLIKKRGLAQDGHENVQHLKNAHASYHAMIKEFPKEFLVINCMRGRKLRPPEDIHEEVRNKIKEKLGL